MNLIQTIILIGLASAVSGRDIHERYGREAKVTIQTIQDQFELLELAIKSNTKEEQVNGALEIFKSKISELQNKEPTTAETAAKHLQSAEKVVKSVKDSLGKLTSGDSLQIAQGVIDIVASVSGFIPPPAGTIVSSVMGMVSGIMGMVSGKKEKSMADVVKEAVGEKLKEHYGEQFQDRVEGAMNQMNLVEAFLQSYAGKRVDYYDYFFVISQFEMLQQVPLAGELASFIKRLSKSPKTEDAEKAVVLIDAYVKLTSMIEFLMRAMQSILSGGRTKLSFVATGNVIARAREQVKENLEFLRNPKQENGLVIAAYDSREHLDIEKIMNSSEIPKNDAGLKIGKCYGLKHKKTGLSVHYGSYSHDRANYLTGESNHNVAEPYKFNRFPTGTWGIKNKGGETYCSYLRYKPTQEPDSIYFIHSRCNDRHSSVRSEFEIIKFSDGDFMILNRGEEGRVPVYMRENDVHFLPLTVKKRMDWLKDEREYVWAIGEANC